MLFLPFEPNYDWPIHTISSVSILKIVHSYDQSGWSLPMHSHPDQCEILYIEDGKGIYTVDNHPYYVKKGDLLIFNSNVIHSLYSDPKDAINVWSCAVCGFQTGDLPDNCILPAGISPVYSLGEQEEFVHTLYQTIASQRENEMPGYGGICNALAVVLLLFCIQLTSNQGIKQNKGNTSIADEVITYIDNHYYEPITMESLSTHFHISASRLSHIVTESYHISPISYLINRRISQAQWELVSTNYTIREIAEHVGYENTHHFCNMFQKRTGYSPSVMRTKYTLQNNAEQM